MRKPFWSLSAITAGDTSNYRYSTPGAPGETEDHYKFELCNEAGQDPIPPTRIYDLDNFVYGALTGQGVLLEKSGVFYSDNL